MSNYFFILLCESAGVPADDRNWPPFFPIIHHDIANEIPVHAQRLQYLAFASWLGNGSLLFKCVAMQFYLYYFQVLRLPSFGVPIWLLFITSLLGSLNG